MAGAVMSAPTILQLFDDWVARTPDAFAFTVHGDATQTHTWQEWQRDARCFATALSESLLTARHCVE